MSWDFALIAVRGDVRDRASNLFEDMGLGSRSSDGAVSFDQATSMEFDGSAVAYTGEWTVVTDPTYFGFLSAEDEHPPGSDGFWPVPVANTLQALSADHTVWGFVMDDTALFSGFVTYTDGTIQRCWLARADTTVLDHGNPVPAERSIDIEDDTPYEKTRAILRETVASTGDLLDLQWTAYR